MFAARPMAGPQFGDAAARHADARRRICRSISLAVASAASAFKSTHTMCAPSLTSRWAASLPMPLPAPMTTTTCRASSFSAGMRLQLRLFEQPVFDVERFLLRQRDVFVDRFGAAHHLDGAVVELGGHARLGLVLAPGDHAAGRG